MSLSYVLIGGMVAVTLQENTKTLDPTNPPKHGSHSRANVLLQSANVPTGQSSQEACNHIIWDMMRSY